MEYSNSATLIDRKLYLKGMSRKIHSKKKKEVRKGVKKFKKRVCSILFFFTGRNSLYYLLGMQTHSSLPYSTLFLLVLCFFYCELRLIYQTCGKLRVCTSRFLADIHSQNDRTLLVSFHLFFSSPHGSQDPKYVLPAHLHLVLVPTGFPILPGFAPDFAASATSLSFAWSISSTLF